MITLVLFICSIESGSCIIHSLHKYPYFMPVFTTSRDCNDEGNSLKKNLKEIYKERKDPTRIKFRCINWGTPI